jgi:hypothetical protein
MRFSQFVVFLTLLTSLLACSTDGENDSAKDESNTITLSGHQQRDTVFLNFDIPERTILAKRTGKLERLVESPEIKKNSLLIQFDDYDAFIELSGEKESLKEEITNTFNNVPKSLKLIEKKWRDFANKLTPDKLTPSLPEIEYKEEAGLIEETHIQEMYQSIQKKELSITNYFQLSPEDGFITNVYAHSDDNVKKNNLLISYHPKKVTVTAKASFVLSKSIQKQLAANLQIRVPVEKEVILAKTDNQITYQLTLKQKVNVKNFPKYFIVNHDDNVFSIPKEFVDSSKSVLLISEKGTTKRKVIEKNGTYFIYDSSITITLQKP